MLSPAKSRKSRLLIIPSLVILMTLGLFIVPGFSGTYKIYSTADAVVISSAPNNNYGADTVVDVGRYGASTLYYYYAYFKFDLTSQIPSTEQITGGALYAYCDNVNVQAVSCQLRASDTSWIESGPGGITWNNKPAPGTTVITTATGSIGWDHWNIPAANLPATGLVSFVLIPANSGTSEFLSREYGSPYIPYLQVTTKKKPQSGAAKSLLLLQED